LFTNEWKHFKLPSWRINSVFLGEHDDENQPEGFVRLANKYGNIFEACISKDGRMNGFCVLYLGFVNEIHVGWYKKN